MLSESRHKGSHGNRHILKLIEKSPRSRQDYSKMTPKRPPNPRIGTKISLSPHIWTLQNSLVAAVACTFSLFGPTRPAHIHIICPMWCPSDPKVSQSHSHRPKMTPKLPQNDSKVSPACPHSCIKSLKSIRKRSIF